MEEAPADILPVLLPIVVVVVAVVGFVAIVFWVGSGKKRSYEEAKALASKKAEEKLKEREKKLHASPRAFKGRRNFRKKKSDDAADETPAPSQPAKGILKSGGGGATVSQSPSTVPAVERPKVDFKLNTTPPKISEVSKDSRISPPTPYPKESTGTRASSKEDGPPPTLSLNDDETDVPSATATRKGEAKKQVSTATNQPTKGSTPSPKPTGTTQPAKGAVPTTTRAASTDKAASSQKKPKSKSKQSAVVGLSQDAMPASRITDILDASSLSDGEIQRLIELLLEKSNANEEWEAANFKTDSNKSLKKSNAELQAKLEEAQQTVIGQTNKIKELRREIQTEKNKHTAALNGLNDKIGQQNNELTIFKTKASGLEEEMKKLKEMYDQQALQKLSEETGHLKSELARYKQQVQDLTKAQAEHAEHGRSLQNELERSREQLKAAPSMADQLVEQKSRDVERLNGELNYSRKEISRLKSELGAAFSDKDSSMQSMEASVKSLKKKLDEATAERDAIRSNQDRLKLELDQAKASQTESENLQKAGQKSQSEGNEKLKKAAAKAEQEKVEMVGRVKDLESNVANLGKERDTLKGQLTQLEKTQETARKLEQEKALVLSERQGLEEKLARASKQLEEEISSKKDLEEKLASRHEVASPVQQLSNGGEGVEMPQQQELTKENNQLKEEVSVLKKKVEDFKQTNSELSDNLGKAKSEVAEEEKQWEKKLRQVQVDSEQRSKAARTDALRECHDAHKGAWQQLFPSVAVSDCDRYERWLEDFEAEARQFLDDKASEIDDLKRKVEGLEQTKEESTAQIVEFRDTMEATMGILSKLQSEVDSRAAEHQKAMEDKEKSLEKERASNKKLKEDLCSEKAKLTTAMAQLKKEQEASARLREEVEAETDRQAKEEQSGRIQELEKRLQEFEEEQKVSKEKIAGINEKLNEKEKACSESEQRLADECRLKEEATARAAELKSDLERTQGELKIVSEKLDIMKRSNRELNARLSPRASATDSEV